MKKEMTALLPKPQKIAFTGGGFAWPRGPLACRVPDDVDLSAFFQEQSRLFRPVADAARAALVARIDHNALAGRAADPALLDEGYVLEVAPRGLTLSARTGRGLYYGLQTVRQLAAERTRLPGMRIEDWPDMAFRGLHLMLGCVMPTFERMKRIVEILARHKINALVVEYDNCFKWEKYPFISHPSAYTADQTRELEKFAAARGLEIIPCLDSLGHLEPYLGHKQLAHLRENPESSGSLCPSNPEAMAFMQDLWREVLAGHPRARRAHITGDEVFGGNGKEVTCPVCRRRAGREGVGGLIVSYYTALSRWILDQGRVPMMWNDMLAKHAEATARLPNDIVMCDWMYENADADSWDMEEIYWNATEGSRPGAWERQFGPYWKPDRHGRIQPFPYLRAFRDKGHPVLGCPAGSGGSRLVPYPSLAQRHANIMRFAAAVKEAGTMGMLNTFWPMPTPLESAWNSVLMGADYAWHARVESPAAFADRFAQAFLEMPRGGAAFLQGLDSALSNAPVTGQTAMLAKSWPEKSAGPLVKVSRELVRSTRDADRAPFIRIMDWCARFTEVTERLGAVFNRIDAARLGRGRDEAVDLGRHLTHDFLDATVSGAFAVPFKSGQHRLAGVDFRIADGDRNRGKSVITLRGRRMQAAPLQVNNIAVGRRADRLFILCSGFDTYDNVAIAEVAIKMEDGSCHNFPIVGGKNILDWSGSGNRVMPEGIFVTERRGRKGCLCWWNNPTPQVPVASIGFRSSGLKGSLTIAAVTTRVLAGKQPGIDRPSARRTLQECRTEIRGLVRELAGSIYPAIIPRQDAGYFPAGTEKYWQGWIDVYDRILKELPC